MERPPSSISQAVGLAVEGLHLAKNLKVVPISLLAAPPNLLEMPPHMACNPQVHTMPLPIAQEAGRVVTEFQ